MDWIVIAKCDDDASCNTGSTTVNEIKMLVHDSVIRVANSKYITTSNARNDPQRISCYPEIAH
jgi:ribosomal protein L33